MASWASYFSSLSRARVDLDELLLGEGVVELARAVGIISGWGLGYFMCEFFS